jgi:hypothetical protein
MPIKGSHTVVATLLKMCIGSNSCACTHAQLACMHEMCAWLRHDISGELDVKAGEQGDGELASRDQHDGFVREDTSGVACAIKSCIDG